MHFGVVEINNLGCVQASVETSPDCFLAGLHLVAGGALKLLLVIAGGLTEKKEWNFAGLLIGS